MSNIDQDFITFEEKEKLERKINEVTSRRDYVVIYHIFMKDDSGVSFSQNNNSVMMMLGNVSRSTFDCVMKYIEKIEKKRLLKEKENETKMENFEPYMKDEHNMMTHDKLTTTERNIIRKQKYDQNLKEQCDHNIKIYNDATQ